MSPSRAAGGRILRRAIAAAALAVAAAGPQVRAQDASPAARAERRRVFDEFSAALSDFRRGGGDPAELLDRANTLAERYDRPDIARITRFYAGLGADDRRAGWQALERYHEVAADVERAFQRGIQADVWTRIERPRAVAALEAIAAQQLADPEPAARAHSLLSVIHVQHAEDGLAEAERRPWLDLAEKHARRSLELFDSIGMETPEVRPLISLARVSKARGDLSEARAVFERCYRDAIERGLEGRLREAVMGLFWVAGDLGDTHEQDELLRTLATLLTPEQCWPMVAAAARRLLADGHPAAALDLLMRTPPAEGGSEYDLADFEYLCGTAARSLDRWDEAREHFERARAGHTRWACEVALARTELRAGDLQAAAGRIASLESRELPDQTRMNFLSLRGEIRLAQGDPAGALPDLEAALAIGDRADRERWEDALALQAVHGVIGEWLGLHTVALYAEALVETARPVAALRAIESFQARSLRDRAERERALRSRLDPSWTGADLSESDLRAWASAAELGLVSWVVGYRFSVAVWMAPDGRAFGQRLDAGRLDVLRAQRRLREAVLEEDDARASALAREIYTELFPSELRARIDTLPAATSERPRLFLCLHGPLAELAVERLETGAGALLDERLVPLALAGLPEPEPGARSPGTGWSVLGAPELSGAPDLPGAEAELEAVGRLHPGARIALGRAFDRAALEEALRQRRNVHVATHLLRGPGCQDPRYSPEGLLLGDGDVFCSEDVAAGTPGLDLVVLSACDTARGRFVDADGVRGVARAFLEGGTRNLLVTLWPVEDDAARRFAVSFHQGLRAGLRPSAATSAARASLRQQGASAADWAAFRFLGRD